MYCMRLQLNPNDCSASGAATLLLGIFLKQSRDTTGAVDIVVTFGQPMVNDHNGALALRELTLSYLAVRSIGL